MRLLYSFLLFYLLSGVSFAQNNEEFRATWVITWEWTMSSGTVEQQQAKIRGILDDHKKGNFNAVLWQVRQSGTAYYPSSYEPWGSYLGSQNPGFDPLAYAVQETHARGMEFHAWFNVFQTSSTAPGTPVGEHPEWVCRDQADIPMSASRSISPGLEAVRSYTKNVAMEIVNNYDIDGLHLDYVRWSEYSNSSQSVQLAKFVEASPTLDGMITDTQLEDLKINAAGRYLYDIEHSYSNGVPASFSSWEDWWRWSVTEFVRTLHDSIQAVKPWVRLSPAALGKYNWSGWNGYSVVFQDAALWFNEGYIDQLTPMHYHWLTGSGFKSILDGGCPECWYQYIQPGITAGRLFSVGPGSYRFAENNVWQNHPQVIDAVRQIDWVDGFQFFSYRSWDNNDYWEKASDSFFNNKTKIRATKLLVGDQPDPPIVNLTKTDSLNYQIDVNPPQSINTNHRFILYRSPDSDFNINTDEIVDIHFGNSSYSVQEQFSGFQNYNKEYFYFATTVDRYWNESAISNFMQSDSITSFAPTVLNFTPMDGDTVAVNSALEINFSKTIETTTFLSAFSIVPDLQVSQLIWSNENKNVSVVFSQNFEYSTNYSVILNSFLTDVNGKPFDGNGDNVPGDSLVFNFVTKDFDIDGPKILTSNPDYNIKDVSFDVENVITVVFDEQIKSEMINDTTILLSQNENPVPIIFNLFDVGIKSVLNIQSSQAMQMNTEYSLLLSQFIPDTMGNPIGSDVYIPFKTKNLHYYEVRNIDQFISVGDWWQPDDSGSTSGIDIPNTMFESSREVYLPISKSPLQKNSAKLTYKWKINESSFLLREHLAGGTPRSVEFDTTYILQCFVFGDGSNNKFRFAIDEAHGASWPDHEVSKWISIDWYGWKLVEWVLSDPTSVGSWLSAAYANEILDGSKYRIDSFQLTYEPGAAISGEIYFDNLRLVKKSSSPVAVDDYPEKIPGKFVLYQNYPNPFNPTTTIPFSLKKKGVVQLTVYDINGREVVSLVNRSMEIGSHQVHFDATGLSSGLYFYRLIGNGQVLTKSMMFVK